MRFSSDLSDGFHKFHNATTSKLEGGMTIVIVATNTGRRIRRNVHHNQRGRQ